MKKQILLGLGLGAVVIALSLLIHRGAPPPQGTPLLPPPLAGSGTNSTGVNLEKLKREMLAQLNKKEPGAREVPLPDAPALIPEPPAVVTAPEPVLSPEEMARRAGRKQRSVLPMGVVLVDHVPVYAAADAKTKIFEMMTGDLVRVFPDTGNMAHVQPGLDVYLAATTKKTEPAGLHLPDKDGWVRKSDLRIFEEQDAKEFLTEVDPVTLGNDPSFSTVDFYVRAMKNPDPVVHRVMGPRMVALVLLHDDYSTLWSALYRDKDPKVRDAALAYLKERGVGSSRPVIEDLIKRLAELTQTKAAGERELEVLSILSILKESGHPRVKAAIASFAESWSATQSDAINDAARQILSH